MPAGIGCFELHRNHRNMNCGICSSGLAFEITSLKRVEVICHEIVMMLNISDDMPTPKSVCVDIYIILMELCSNGFEHGELNISKKAKERMRSSSSEGYIELIDRALTHSGIKISVTVCVNKYRVFVGVHDNGRGFLLNDFLVKNQDCYTKHGGLNILSEFGGDIYGNNKGNSIYYSYYL